MERDLVISNTIKQLEREISAMQETIRSQRLDTQRYNKLRRLEIVIMEKGGAQYLKGQELDKYLDRLTVRRTRAEIMDEALNAMNNAFNTEYNSRYVIDPRGESQEADKEATR
jgi:hypothetical protein